MGQVLTASKVFTALSLFGLINAPMMQLPQIIATWMQAFVSYKRFTEFLGLEERDPNAVTSTVSAHDIDVEILNGSFGWDVQNPFFQNLNLTIKRGEIVVLHGSVGEGKSSLCNVILGELEIYEGSVGVNGRIAYFSQQPWIQNMTIRENILFGLPYDRVKYNKVIEACALEKDLTLFAAGDRTEIGTKGVNVSGGQKARISLARACYSDADIYILDSPLSAVDAISLLGAPVRFFDTNPMGRILNRLSGDMNQVDGEIPGSVSYFLTTLWMGFILLPLLWMYFNLGSFFILPARELERLTKTTRSPLISHIYESIDGFAVLRAFGSSHVQRFERIHQARVDMDIEANFSLDLAEQWFSLRIGLVSAGLILVTTLSLIVMRQYLTAGLIGLVFNYALQMTSQLEGLVWIWSSLETAMIAPERVAEYTNVEQEAARIIPGSTPNLWPQDGSIQSDNVSFRYKPNDPLVLKYLNFQVRSGEKIGVVGRTGAGKSSLIMALFRINEIASGTITISGVNTATIGIKTLRENMAIIPQNPVLFKGTLRSFLDPFEQCTDAQLWDALSKVRLTSRISSVSDK
ncbi:unnamed protein product [Aphanomyces euteiches]